MGKVLKGVEWNGVRVEVVRTDITKEKTDVIVNAANEQLQHGGYVQSLKVYLYLICMTIYLIK